MGYENKEKVATEKFFYAIGLYVFIRLHIVPYTFDEISQRNIGFVSLYGVSRKLS